MVGLIVMQASQIYPSDPAPSWHGITFMDLRASVYMPENITYINAVVTEPINYYFVSVSGRNEVSSMYSLKNDKWYRPTQFDSIPFLSQLVFSFVKLFADTCAVLKVKYSERQNERTYIRNFQLKLKHFVDGNLCYRWRKSTVIKIWQNIGKNNAI